MNHQSSFRFGCVVHLAVLLLGLASAARSSAANLLVNPGFEADTASLITGWSSFGVNAYGQTGTAAHDGTNYFKVYQAFTGVVNTTGIYQENSSAPGNIYAADGWAYTLAADKLAGQNAAWIEVSFRDINGTVLALYRSARIATNLIGSVAFPTSTWVNLPVTNQYNPGTLALTNTVTSLIAPSGTSLVRYQVTLQGDQFNSGGSMYFDDLTLVRTGTTNIGGTQWNIVWSDEFNGTSLDTSRWTFETGNNNGWGNNEREYYTSRATNAYVAGGSLHIVARKETMGGFPYTSARLKTQGKFSRKYGRFEFRARLPHGTGYWPALWMMGNNISSIGWPACGEIDVLENQGANLTTVQGTLHYGTATTNHLSQTKVYNVPAANNVTNFHTYAVNWTTNSIVWLVDNVPVQTWTSWSSTTPYPAPYNQPFFLIMNLAVGGQYLGSPSDATIDANTAFPGELEVDYIRVYDTTPPLQLSVTRSNGNPLLTWPTNIVCRLQKGTNLATQNWVDLAGQKSPALLPSAGEVGYYRLASP